MRRLGRVVRAVVLNTIAVVGALVLVATVLFGVAQTAPAERFLRRQIVSGVNAGIAGTIDIGALRFEGNRLVLDDIQIRTPERDLVGRIHRVSATLGFGALTRRTIHIEDAAVVEPAFSLRSDERGLNLSRALHSTKPPSKKPLAFRVALDRLAVDGGRVDYRDAVGKGRARVAGLTVRAHAHVDALGKRGNGALQVNGQLEEPSRAPLQITGSGRLLGDHRSAALSAIVGDSVVRADGSSRGDSIRARAFGRHIDLASFLPEGARSDLAFSLDLVGSGRTWRELDGHLNFDIPASRAGADTIGPVQVRARSEREGERSLNALATMPGLNARLNGQGDVRRVQARGEIAVNDAGRLLRAAGTLTGRPMPQASGSATISMSADGAPGALRQARVDLTSRQLAVGKTAIRALSATATTEGDTLRSRASLQSPMQVAMDLAGTWVGRGHRVLDLRQMRVQYPQATWSLVEPARIAVVGDRVQIDDFKLHSAPNQQLAVNFLKTGRRLSANVVLSALRLASLPLREGRTRLTGVVDGTVRARGTPEAPVADADLSVRQAQIGRYSGVEARLAAHVEQRRAKGTFTAKSADGWARGRFALPAAWPLPPNGAVSLDATARIPELAALPVAASARPTLEGAVQLALSVRGSAKDPRFELVVNADDLSAAVPQGSPGAPVVDLNVRATYAGDRGILRVRGRSDNGGELALHARVNADVSLARPAAAIRSIRRAPVSATLVANDFDLSPLATVAASKRIAATGGRLGGEVRVAGTVAKPAVQGRLSWRDGRVVVKEP